MIKKSALILVFFVVSFATARAETVLQRVADGINVGEIKTLQYTGNGMMFELGQHATPIGPLPRFYLKSLTRVIDFNGAAMRDELVRTQGEEPARGGGAGQPIVGEQRQIQLVHGDYAWNEAGKDVAPRPWEATNRHHQIWVTPQGFVRAALALRDPSFGHSFCPATGFALRVNAKAPCRPGSVHLRSRRSMV